MPAIARWCFRHRFVVIAAWVIVLADLGALGQGVKSTYASSFALSGTGSTMAQQLLARAVPAQAGDSDTIVWQVAAGTVRNPAIEARMTGVLHRITTMPEVAAVQSPYQPRGAGQISRDGRIAYATVNFTKPSDNLADADVKRVISAAEAARAPGLNIQLGGDAIGNTEQTSLGFSSVIGVAAAAVVLFIAFGSLLAMLLPIVTAIAGVVDGLMAIAPLTHTMSVASFAPILGALIGLGVGTDYALFIVTRHRRGLQSGLTPEDTAVTPINTSGRAVLFAGGTVCMPDLSLPEIARVVDQSVTRAAGEEDFVTAVFAELDPRGWLQPVICGHPAPLRLTADGGRRALTPRVYATPLGLHPDLQPSVFSVSTGDRLVFYTDGLLEARDRAGRSFRVAAVTRLAGNPARAVPRAGAGLRRGGGRGGAGCGRR